MGRETEITVPLNVCVIQLALPVKCSQSQRIVLLIPSNHLPFLSWSGQHSFSAREAGVCSIPFVSDTQLGSLHHTYYSPPYAMWTLPYRETELAQR